MFYKFDTINTHSDHLDIMDCVYKVQVTNIPFYISGSLDDDSQDVWLKTLKNSAINNKGSACATLDIQLMAASNSNNKPKYKIQEKNPCSILLIISKDAKVI